jgi:hypothetical protein
MTAPTVAKSDLICDLIDIISKAKRPRFPKWRFKIDDMALDLEYRDKYDPPYLQGALYYPLPGTPGTPGTPKERDAVRWKCADWWHLNFHLVEDDGDASLWRLERTWGSSPYDSMSRSSMIPRELLIDLSDEAEAKRRVIYAELRAKDQQVKQAATAKLIAIFNEHRLDTLDTLHMLEDRCLLCGRGLTDPVSRHRWIGPECWGKWAIRPAIKRFAPPAEEGGQVEVEKAWA